MIKIRHTNLPEGLHVEIKREGAKTIIYLAPALTRTQRRAAFVKARQAARVGRSVPLPFVPLALAIGADRIKITSRSAAAAARVHPVAFAVPAGILITAVILYTFVTSVTIQLSRPRALGPGPGGPPATAAPSAGSQQPAPGPSTGIGTVGKRAPGTGQGGHGQQHSPGRLPSPAPPSPNPAPPTSPSPSAAPTAAPSPVPSQSGGGTVCVQVGSIQICAQLRAGG